MTAGSNHKHDPINQTAALEYSCPMHPEVVQNEPGSCPKCGMFLEPHEKPADSGTTTLEYSCPMHPEVVQNEPGSCSKCGMFLEPHEKPADSSSTTLEYSCPMHPEVVQNKPSSCPKCGMNLEAKETPDNSQNHTHNNADHNGMNHNGMNHNNMNHDDMAFMSMIDVTKDLPRSDDGLPMDWINVPFGPFFPGLPGGLLLTLTLDGDTVAGANAQTLVENTGLWQQAIDSKSLVEQLAKMDPLSPFAYRFLACRAIENIAAIDIPATTAGARIGALERERIASHLNWLALFAQQVGFNWLARHAASLQLKCLHGERQQILTLKSETDKLIRRLQKTPLLKSRTAGIGQLAAVTTLQGPVARASGMNNDSRCTDPIYTALGFKPCNRKTGDALARLHVRLDEIKHSFALIEAIDTIEPATQTSNAAISGSGEAVVETPRGLARLQLTLENGQVTSAQLTTPSTYHITLIKALTAQQELGDALVAVGSLDISPWEIQQ